MYNIYRFVLQECGGLTWWVSDCEELVGDVNHTTECVTDLFIFCDILFTTESFEFFDYHHLRHIDSFHQLLFP